MTTVKLPKNTYRQMRKLAKSGNVVHLFRDFNEFIFFPLYRFDHFFFKKDSFVIFDRGNNDEDGTANYTIIS